MKLKVKDMDIATGGLNVVIINEQDASLLDLHHMDRIVLTKGKRKSSIATLDIAESKKAVPPGKIGLFEEVLFELGAKQNDEVTIELAAKPESVMFIKRKMDGFKLNEKEITAIVEDIVHNRLTDIELTSFIVSSYSLGMSMKEVAYMTKAMAKTGDTLKINHKIVIDLHSIGGVPGNRTTMLMVPLLIAAGCKVPKTSSRAITSPAGTADTMEVLCNVGIPIEKLPELVDEVGGFLIWGGAVNLAPADDKIIQVEHPLNIDAEGQMIASIMAKKASVGATHLLLEIPVGKTTKAPTKREAKHLAKHFAQIGNMLGIKVKTMITDGSEPVGRGIGPSLEVIDVLLALRNDPRAPQDLIRKSLDLTAELLEFCGKAKKGKGLRMARQLLENGDALKVFQNIVSAQGGKKLPDPDKVKKASHTYTFKAKKTGKIKSIDNKIISKIARLAGAPKDHKAGLYLYKHRKETVKKGEPILTIFAHNKTKLEYSKKYLKSSDAIVIK